MNDNQADQAKTVTRAIVNSVAKLEAEHGVSADVILEGLMKAVAVYGLQKLESVESVAHMFQTFARSLRDLPQEKFNDPI